MKTFRDTEELKQEVVALVNSNSISVITIDGKDGVGKTCLAKRLCADTRYVPIDLDDDRYLHKNQGGCLGSIKFDVLEEKIREYTNDNKTVIIGYICIQKILDKIGIKSDLTIY